MRRVKISVFGFAVVLVLLIGLTYNLPNLARTTIVASPHSLVGTKMPPFSFTSLDNPKIVYTNDTMRGKIYLIDFWATWCPPCRGEMKHLHKAHEKFKGKDFEILSISFDSDPRVVQDFRRYPWKMPWNNVVIESSCHREVARRFEVSYIPKPLLVNKRGTIIAAEEELRGENLEKTLNQVLGKPESISDRLIQTLQCWR